MDIENLNDENFETAAILCDGYRKQFFRQPNGARPWRDTTPLDGIMTDYRLNQMAESFHDEFCILCKANNYQPEIKPNAYMDAFELAVFAAYKKIKKPHFEVKLKLFNQSGAYYFKCSECAP